MVRRVLIHMFCMGIENIDFFLIIVFQDERVCPTLFVGKRKILEGDCSLEVGENPGVWEVLDRRWDFSDVFSHADLFYLLVPLRQEATHYLDRRDKTEGNEREEKEFTESELALSDEIHSESDGEGTEKDEHIDSFEHCPHVVRACLETESDAMPVFHAIDLALFRCCGLHGEDVEHHVVCTADDA